MQQSTNIPQLQYSITSPFRRGGGEVVEDYTPFGMQMGFRGKNAVSANYRFGFNGKKNDNEVKGTGNQQDYGFRIYDPRLGRFLSVDPLFKDYPELTTFQFSSNSPIINIDLDGLEGVNSMTQFNNLQNSGKTFLKIIDAIPDRPKKAIKGVAQVVGGGVGVVSSMGYIVATEGFGAAFGGVAALSISASTFGMGLRNLGAAYEGADESQYPKYDTYVGPVAKELGASEKQAGYIDKVVSIVVSPFSKTQDKFCRTIDKLSTAQTVARFDNKCCG